MLTLIEHNGPINLFQRLLIFIYIFYKLCIFHLFLGGNAFFEVLHSLHFDYDLILQTVFYGLFAAVLLDKSCSREIALRHLTDVLWHHEVLAKLLRACLDRPSHKLVKQ